MKGLIAHLLRENREQVLERSLLNCHVKGVHSIMLMEAPEKTIRLYYAEKDCDLWLNARFYLDSRQPLAFHPHHCNLTIECIKGTVFNWRVKTEKGLYSGDPIVVDKYKYNSEITHGKIGFSFIEETAIYGVDVDMLEVGDFVCMDANEIHTVYTLKNSVAAWLVYEGKEDKQYESVCYSKNMELEKNDFSGLYQKMDSDSLEIIINNLF